SSTLSTKGITNAIGCGYRDSTSVNRGARGNAHANVQYRSASVTVGVDIHHDAAGTSLNVHAGNNDGTGVTRNNSQTIIVMNYHVQTQAWNVDGDSQTVLTG